MNFFDIENAADASQWVKKGKIVQNCCKEFYLPIINRYVSVQMSLLDNAPN